MDPSHLQFNTHNHPSFSKLSPFTTATSLSDASQLNTLPQNLQIDTQLEDQLSINNKIPPNPCQNQTNHLHHSNRFQTIQKNIMQYFQTKGIVAGHPEEWKKQYNRKLHKKASLNIEVSQVINDKAQQGSSLLSRRLKKKMTIIL